MTKEDLPEGSTIRRPSGKPLAIFHLGMIPKSDTVQTYIDEGWSLGIVCKECMRLVEWTPERLQQLFPAPTSIRAIAKKLKCSGPDGCGSDQIAVFPHNRAADLEELERKRRQSELF